MIKIDNLAIVALFVVSILISGIQEASASSNQTQNYSKYLETNKLIGTMPGFQDPAGFGYDSTNGNIYVGNHGSNYVSAVSGSTNKVLYNVTVGPPSAFIKQSKYFFFSLPT